MSINSPLSRTALSHAVRVVVHPPERGPRRSSVPAQAGPCCCSCCCCCLHTLGGLIGAAVASNLAGPPRRSADLPLPHAWEGADLDLSSWTGARRQQEAVTRRAPAPPNPPDEAAESLKPNRPVTLHAFGPSAVSLFWRTLLLLAVAGVTFSTIKIGSEGFAVGLWFLVLILPAVQLGAAILVALILAVSRRPDKRYQLLQIVRIALGVMVGAGAGLMLMVALGFLL